MSEKKLNTRIQQKHDIEVNWLKAVNFIPKIGEIIVYDPDENHAAARVKIGDGVKTIIELAFIDDAAKAALFEEIDMVDEKVEALDVAVGNKVDKSSITDSVEENNANLVTSGAVYSAIRTYVDESILGGEW